MLGLSGSGKSLTAKALLGLLPQAAKVSSGQAIYTKANGQQVDLLALNEAGWRQLRGREISLVFQEPLTALNPVQRVGKQLLEAVRNLCPELTTDRVRMEHLADWLTRVELPDEQERILGAFPHELSGGQRQRLLIALALLGGPRLLIADEPTTALDTITERGILSLLAKLREELGMTMIFITHDLEVLRNTTTRTIVLRGGRLVHQGSTKEILALPGAGLTDEARPSELPITDGNPGPPRSEVLKVVDLEVNYAGKKAWPWSEREVHPAVKGVSFSVSAGEWVAIVGPSGCGKTTTARCIAGLERISAGTIEVPERGAQLVFQDPFSSLNPKLTVQQTLEEVLRLRPTARHTCGALLQAVGLPAATFAGRLPGQLSGGQRQRVAIARALAADPVLLIADEAVSALDAPLRAEVLNLLDRLRQQYHIGLLFISHDLNLVKDRADRVLIMDNGKIVEAGATAKVFAQPQAALTRKLLGRERK